MGLFRRKENKTVPYSSIESLDACLQESNNVPVLILKHSTICPVSGMGKNQADRFLEENPVKAYLLIVQQERPLSNEIAERLQVRHETPQVILLKDGAAVKVFSHYEITIDNLKNSLSTA